jgi:hypothetical protein
MTINCGVGAAPVHATETPGIVRRVSRVNAIASLQLARRHSENTCTLLK